MTSLDSEQRAQRKPNKQQKRSRRKPRKQVRRPLDVPVAMNPNQILTFAQWCLLNNISVRTGRRILASGDGPVVTRLSTKRIGISVANNATWQAARAR